MKIRKKIIDEPTKKLEKTFARIPFIIILQLVTPLVDF